MRKQGTSSDHWIDELYFWLEAQGFTKPGSKPERKSGDSAKTKLRRNRADQEAD